MASPREFADRMREIAQGVVDNADKGWRLTALAIDQAVVTSTPVDTGRARSNWRVSTTKLSDTIGAYAPGTKGTTAAENTAAALDQGASAIESAEGNVLYISNNLPYIGPLNDGSSAQAPAGFVELAVQAGIETVRRIRLLADE